MDYLALGHWHSLATFLAPDGQVRMAYSGTPEPTQFGERDSGAALIVDISTSQGPVQLTPVRTGGLRWTDLRPEVRETRDLEKILEDIEAIADPQSTLVQMTLSCLLTPDGGRLLKRIEEILSSRFLLGRLVHSSLLPSPEDPSWVNRLPVGIVREAGWRCFVERVTVAICFVHEDVEYRVHKQFLDAPKAVLERKEGERYRVLAEVTEKLSAMGEDPKPILEKLESQLKGENEDASLLHQREIAEASNHRTQPGQSAA